MNLRTLPFVSTEKEWETWAKAVKPIYFEREFLRLAKASGFVPPPGEEQEIIDCFGNRMLKLLRKSVKKPEAIYLLRFIGCLIEPRYGIYDNECYVFLPRNKE